MKAAEVKRRVPLHVNCFRHTVLYFMRNRERGDQLPRPPHVLRFGFQASAGLHENCLAVRSHSSVSRGAVNLCHELPLVCATPISAPISGISLRSGLKAAPSCSTCPKPRKRIPMKTFSNFQGRSCPSSRQARHASQSPVPFQSAHQASS